MAVSAVLRRLAGSGPVPVFAAPGLGAGWSHLELAAHPGIQLVSTPRRATVLVALGSFPGDLGGALVRVHDQLPHPRTVVLDGRSGSVPGPMASRATTAPPGHLVPVVLEAHRALLAGELASTADVAVDEPPNPFEGRGGNGQGGDGMMGGVPYGRPMAMTGDDRDGLALDRLPVRLGPFLVGLPAGLAVDVVLQGDVVQEATFRTADAGPGPVADDVADCFAQAATTTVPVAVLERARARHLLRWSAETCRLAGLGSLAVRAAGLAAAIGRGDPPAPTEVDRLARAMRLSGLLAHWQGLGAGLGAGMGGPNARAAGSPADARTHDPAYQALGFVPVTHGGDDAGDRLRQRVDEAIQALGLAREAEGQGLLRSPGPDLEPPAALPGGGLDDLARAVTGRTWPDALATILSLDPGHRLATILAAGS